jgi:hypothetical protein
MEVMHFVYIYDDHKMDFIYNALIYFWSLNTMAF